MAITLYKSKRVGITYLKGRWESGRVREMSSLVVSGPPTKLGKARAECANS